MAQKILMTVESSSSGFSIYADGFPVHGTGKTIAEAKEDLMAGLEDLNDYYKTKGKEIPSNLNSEKIEFEYQYELPVIFEILPMLDATNLAKQIKMNPSLLRQYKAGSAQPGKKALKKIEQGLHALGKELLSVRL